MGDVNNLIEIFFFFCFEELDCVCVKGLISKTLKNMDWNINFKLKNRNI